MASSVKNKIRLGTVFLFLLLICMGGVSIRYLVKVKNEAKNIIRANYESLEYAHHMQGALDSIRLHRLNGFDSLEAYLQKQEHNITETGEAEATAGLRQTFNNLRNGDTSATMLQKMDYSLQQVLNLNMQAIHLKNEKAQHTASNAVTFLITLAVFVFIVGFTFAFNFPSVLTTPLQKLTQAIKEIGLKNYGHRIHVTSTDEFGELGHAFNEMAERLEYFESSNLNKLLFEKSRAEAVINSLKDASIGIDKNDTVLFANEQALQLLGLKPASIVGLKVKEVSAHNDLFAFLMNSDNKAPFKIVLDNRENYFTKEMVEVQQGEGSSRVIIIKNITSYKELDVAKTNFIATISHEIKTPLAASDFSLKLLEDERIGKLSTEQKELVQNIKADNQRILKILSELLNMAQVEAGRIQLNKQPIAIQTIIHEAIETVSATARERNIQIHTAIESNLPLILLDAERTTWVLNNFLTNAIKYSPEGGSIQVLAEKDQGMLRICVQDNGPGIAKEYQGRLFERYFQVPGAKSKGTGLGLAISKDFIEAQGGRISVESEVGQGARFCFYLP